MPLTKRLRALALPAWLLLAAAAAAAELPGGFAGIRIGDPWQKLASQPGLRELAVLATEWDRHVYACGYREAHLPTAQGDLYVTVNDHVVTGVRMVTPLRPGSDLLAAADLVMRSYGQPAAASMRDELGRVTIDRERVSFITLRYDEPRAVRFEVSGADLWQYQVSVEFEHRRWHENATYRCARTRASRAGGATAPPPPPS